MYVNRDERGTEAIIDNLFEWASMRLFILILLLFLSAGCSRMMQNLPAKECNKIFFSCDKKSPIIISKEKL